MTKKIIDELTPEQRQLMIEVRDEWINRFFSLPKLNEEKAIEAANFIYSLTNCKAPPRENILFCDSPQQAQDMIKKESGKNKYESPTWTLGICDYDWLAFHDFFQRIGVDYGEHTEAFNKYIESAKCGIYESYLFDTHAFIVRNPMFVHRDHEGRLHSIDSPAVEWVDGLKIYALDGIIFDGEEQKVWEKLRDGTLQVDEALLLENTEHRMIALKYSDVASVLEERAELLDESKKGYKLFLYKDFPEIGDAYFLRYSCPGTGKHYAKCIDPKVGELKNADTAAMSAWNGLTEDLYFRTDWIES